MKNNQKSLTHPNRISICLLQLNSSRRKRSSRIEKENAEEGHVQRRPPTGCLDKVSYIHGQRTCDASLSALSLSVSPSLSLSLSISFPTFLLLLLSTYIPTRTRLPFFLDFDMAVLAACCCHACLLWSGHGWSGHPSMAIHAKY